MIQRIQTIFLLLAGAAFGGLLALPMASSDPTAVGFLADGEYDVSDHVILTILAALGILLSIISIFVFRRRLLQMRLGYLLIVVGILIPSLAYLLFTTQAAEMPANMTVSDEFGMFLPFIAIICAGLANYFIRKDEKLVRSMDRLR